MQLNQPYRKASFLGPPRTIQLPFQWLVLLDVSLVALIIVCPSKSFQKASNQKSPQNPIKIRPKPLQNPPKTAPEPSQNRPRTLLQNWTRWKINFCWFFLLFFESPGPPKIKAKSLKIAKKWEKNGIEKTHVSQHDFSWTFLRFGLRKWSQNQCFFATF